MTRTWIEAITNRTYGDIQMVQSDPTLENAIGVWNAVDLNRIEQNTAYCVEYMLEHKIYTSDPILTIRENNYWTGDMVPTYTEISRIINNVAIITEYAREHNPNVSGLPTIYSSTHIDYVLANNIEIALNILHNQPNPPLDYFTLTINGGIVTTIERADGTIETINASEALIAEDEIATIKGVPEDPDAEYKIFQFWSGDANDLQYLADYQAQETTYLGQYRNVEFTANFQTKIPRTLTLTNAYISVDNDDTAESGPSTGTYYAGDRVMIIANRAATGKAFYQWTGTEEALDNIVGVTSAEDPSTAWLAMPDCDVALTPQYINAGAHTVKVINGVTNSYTTKSYNYNDYASISADTVSHYSFKNWSGNTSYLTDIYSSYQSFKMPDVNLTFTANYSYVYSYNDVQIIDGYISYNGENVSSVSSVKQTSKLTLVPNPPDDTYGLDYWEIEGEGSVSGNTFTVGDGSAIITGHYAKLYTVTVNNVDNKGTTTTMQVVLGHSYTISTSEVLTDYMFEHWESGSTTYTSTSLTFTKGAWNSTYTAVYRAKNSYTLTVVNGSGSGTYKERQSVSISANSPATGYHFSNWSGSYYSISNRYSSSTSIVMPSADCTVTAYYELDKTYHTLTVNYGSGSGTYYEGQSVTINGNQAPDTYEFDSWVIDSGTGTIANTSSKQTYYYMGTDDGEVTATYKAIPYFTVTVENGYVQDSDGNWVESATLIRNSAPAIKMKPAPEGMQFLQWETLEGDDNDVYAPFAETTYIRDLVHNVKVKATYYTPDPEVTYTLTIIRYNGEIDTYHNTAGYQQKVTCSTIPEGMKFYRWEGDYQYLTAGRYIADNYINTPEKDISIEEKFVAEDWTPTFHLYMKGYSECMYETTTTDSETGETTTTENWTEDHEYEENEVVNIRTKDIPYGWKFTKWDVLDVDSNSHNDLLKSLIAEETTFNMPDYDLYISAIIGEQEKYMVILTNGQPTNQSYYEGDRAEIYFEKITEESERGDVKYEFTRWYGVDGTSIAELKDYDTGKQFNVLVAGTAEEPQYIKMPAYDISLEATYNSYYHLTITNGTITDTETTEDYYLSGTKISITANTPDEGQVFVRWRSDENCIENPYDLTTTITMPEIATNIEAIYTIETEDNGTGYVTTSLYTASEVTNSDITILSGELLNGFLITDTKGHIYIITGLGDETSTIQRLTKKEPDYTTLRLIASTGTQYIDTGVPIYSYENFDIIVDIDPSNTPYNYNIILGTASGSTANESWIDSSLNLYSRYASTRSSAIKVNTGVRYKLEYKKIDNTMYVYCNNTLKTSYSVTTTIDTSSLYLFHRDTYYGNNFIYGCQLYTNDELLRDFIPVIDGHGVACLYDKVTKKYYYNAGTGSFTAYYRIDYTPITYIRSTGTQYINFGLYGTSDTKVELKLMKTGSTTSWDMIYGAGEGDISSGWTGLRNRENQFDILTGGTYTGTSLPYIADTIYEISASNRYMTVKTEDGTTKTYSGSTVSYTPASYSMFLFAGNKAGTIWRYTPMKLWYFKVYQSDELVRDIIPIKRTETGVLSLYDKITKIHYAVLPSGSTFEEGEVSRSLLSYIETTGTQYISTGVNSASNVDIEISYYITSGLFYGRVFGTAKDCDYELTNYVRNTNRCRISIGGTSHQYFFNVSTSDYNVVKLLGTGDVYVNNELVNSFGTTPASASNILLFNGYDSEQAACRMTYCKIWQDDILIRNFVPATYR